MAESQSLVNTVLDSIMDKGPDKKRENEYDKLNKNNKIEHSLSYRAHGGRLGGYEPNTASQKFDVELIGTGDTRINLIETGMALLMQRYDTFGPFHQYPKTFFVGPSLWDGGLDGGLKPVTGLSSGLDPRPYVRDVDRLIWVKVGGNKVALNVLQMLHDDMTTPGKVQAYLTTYGLRMGVTRYRNTVQDSDAIKDLFFRDGNEYTFAIPPVDTKYIDVVSPHLSALAIANLLSRDRNAIWSENSTTEAIRVAKATAQNDRMLAIILTGQNPYVIPKEPDQRKHPVTPGKVTLGRLASILKNVVLAPPVETEKVHTGARIDERKMPSQENAISDDESVSSTDESFVRIASWGSYPQSDDEFFAAMNE